MFAAAIKRRAGKGIESRAFGRTHSGGSSTKRAVCDSNGGNASPVWRFRKRPVNFHFRHSRASGTAETGCRSEQRRSRWPERRAAGAAP